MAGEKTKNTSLCIFSKETVAAFGWVWLLGGGGDYCSFLSSKAKNKQINKKTQTHPHFILSLIYHNCQFKP